MALMSGVQDIFLASLEELASALSGLEQSAINDDPLRVLRELLRPDNAGIAGVAQIVWRHALNYFWRQINYKDFVQGKVSQ